MRNSGVLCFLLALGCGAADDATDEPATMPGDRDVPSTTTPGDPGTELGEPQAEVPLEWACLGQVVPVFEREPARVRYLVPVADFDSQPTAPIVVADLQIEVCVDGSCDQPLQRCGTGAPAASEQCFTLSEAEDQPLVSILDLPFGLQSATLRFAAPGYVAIDYQLGGPMIGSPEGGTQFVGLPVLMLREQARAALYGQLGLDAVDPTRGMLIVRTLSCSREPEIGRGVRAAGVKIEPMSDESLADAVVFALLAGNIAAIEPLETDESGLAGIVNLLPQAIAIMAQTPGGPIETVVRIRPNVITLVELRPGLELWGQ